MKRIGCLQGGKQKKDGGKQEKDGDKQKKNGGTRRAAERTAGWLGERAPGV